MNGYGSHTFMWVNAGGERFWVKYHFKTVQGVENFTDAEAKAMVAEDPDYHLRDLFESSPAATLRNGSLEMQIMPFDDAPDYRFNPFDLTKVWPHGDYPPITIGRLVLDRNPENYFAEVEQASFEPANLVPGIGPSPDKMLQGRLFSYPDTHRYRIGANYLQLPINQPTRRSLLQQGRRDALRAHGDQPVTRRTATAARGGPERRRRPVVAGRASEIVRSAYTPHA